MLVSADTGLRLVPGIPGLRAVMKNTVTSRTSGVVMCVFSRSVMSDPLWPMDCCPQGSSVLAISQARILEWRVAISFYKRSS